jgi:hypothetical protein
VSGALWATPTPPTHRSCFQIKVHTRETICEDNTISKRLFL